MEKISEGEIPFTYMTKVLQLIIDKIHAVETSRGIDHVKMRTKIDELIGEFEHFWKPHYKFVQKIYGEEVAKHLQKQLLIYHIRHHKDGYTDGCLWIHIGFDTWGKEDYQNLKTEVLNDDHLSSYLK